MESNLECSNELACSLMRQALEEAGQAALEGEVPIGAVIFHNGQVIARAHNQIEQMRDATAHAEMLAIRKAAQVLNNWRLADAILCVTLEPCVMCLGAIRLARIPTVVFGAGDSRFGACGSVIDLSANTELGPVPRLIPGVLADECRAVLKKFFAERRK